MHERALKTLTDLCKKAAKKSAQNQQPALQYKAQVEALKQEVEVNQTKYKRLQMLSGMLLKKNAELYLKHELMLDDERQQRMDLGTQFQQKMAVIQEELAAEKEQRNK